MNRRTLIVLVAVLMTFAVVRPARAISITNTLPGGTGITYEDVLRAQGLNNEDIRNICLAGNVLDRIDGIISNFQEILKSEIAGLIQDIYTRTIRALVLCGISNVQIFGFKAPLPQCTWSIASDAAAQALEQRKEDYKRNFLAGCGSAVASVQVEVLVDQLLKSQGPEGGPAWVNDYVQSLFVTPDKMAQRRLWAILVNTKICPYFSQQVLDGFGVPESYRANPPNIGGNGLTVDGADPFQLRAACTAPLDYIPGTSDVTLFMRFGGFDLLPILAQPQNNLPGFIMMAQEELAAQTGAMRGQAEAMAAGGSGGFLPFTDSCLRDPDGLCLNIGRITQPAQAVADNLQILNQEQYARALNVDGMQNQAIIDMASRVQARMLDLANQPLPFRIEFGPEHNPDNFTPAPTPIPTGPNDPNDPLCTGGDPRCTCIKDNSDLLQFAQTVIKDAIDRALQVNSELFTSSDGQILPGMRRVVLQAICDRMQPQQGQLCRPHPLQDDEIVIVGGPLTYSFDVIIDSGTCPNGCANISGGFPVAACEAGVQD